MRIERHVVARKAQWLVAFPAAVRRHLGLAPGLAVYWHVATRGQVILTVTGRVKGGRRREDVNCPNCAAMEQEIARLRGRNEARDRALYAEGHTAGYQAATLRQASPFGPSADRARRRRLALHFGSPSARPGRQTVSVPAPPLEAPPPSPPSPSEVSGGDAASGGEAPQAAH